MLYPLSKINCINLIGEFIWDIQKNIEAVEKWALKKEELVKEIKENKS